MWFLCCSLSSDSARKFLATTNFQSVFSEIMLQLFLTFPLPQSPNMVNFLMLLALMTDDHFKSFFLSQQSHVENNFGVLISFQFHRDSELQSLIPQPLVLDLMEVLQNYMGKPPYPDDWCTLYLLQNRFDRFQFFEHKQSNTEMEKLGWHVGGQ